MAMSLLGALLCYELRDEFAMDLFSVKVGFTCLLAALCPPLTQGSSLFLNERSTTCTDKELREPPIVSPQRAAQHLEPEQQCFTMFVLLTRAYGYFVSAFAWG